MFSGAVFASRANDPLWFAEYTQDYLLAEIKLLTEQINANRSNAEVCIKRLLQRAGIYKSMEIYQFAIQDYTEALGRLTKGNMSLNVQIFFDRGEALYLDGNLGSALSDLHQACSLAPQSTYGKRAEKRLGTILADKWKMTISNAILSLPSNERLQLLTACLDPQTCFGKEFAGKQDYLKKFEHEIAVMETYSYNAEEWVLMEEDMPEANEDDTELKEMRRPRQP